MRQTKSEFKSFQDFEPVILKKKTSTNSHYNQKSKSNIHININNTNINDDDIVPIVKYSTEQIAKIREARNALGLTQQELTNKISSSLPKDFISKIEAGITKFDNKTYNTILRKLNISK